MADIQSGKLPEELQLLRESAEKLVGSSSPGPAKKKAPEPAAPEDGKAGVGGATEEESEDAVSIEAIEVIANNDPEEESLAAGIAQMAVSKALEALGEDGNAS